MYGTHTRGWIAALNDQAPIWRVVGAEIRTLPGLSAAEFSEIDPIDDNTIVIPLMENHITSCPRRYRSLFPKQEAIKLLSNKKAFSDYLIANGLEHLAPKAYSVDDVEFPCVIKRLDLNAGTGVEIVRNKEELRSFLATKPWLGHPVILQEYIESDFDFVTHAVCRAGEIVWRCTYRLSIEPRGAIQRPNNTVARTKVDMPDHIYEALQSLVAPLHYDGPLNFDYKLTGDNQLQVVEINPRLGGSLLAKANMSDLAEAIGAICRFSYKP